MTGGGRAAGRRKGAAPPAGASQVGSNLWFRAATQAGSVVPMASSTDAAALGALGRSAVSSRSWQHLVPAALATLPGRFLATGSRHAVEYDGR